MAYAYGDDYPDLPPNLLFTVPFQIGMTINAKFVRPAL